MHRGVCFFPSSPALDFIGVQGRRMGLSVGVRLFLLLFLLHFAWPHTAIAKDIVLGMSAAFSGPSRGLGIELYRGTASYLEYVNQNGLLGDKRIVLKAYDDGYQPGPAVANTIKLIEEDDVFLLFNYVGTPTMVRVLPLLLHERYRQEHAFLYFPFTGAEFQREAPYRPFVFNLRASYREETHELVDHFLRIGRKRIAVFYQADAYGRSGWDGVRRALAKKDLAIVSEATYRRGGEYSENYSRQVTLLRAADPDAVICVGVYAACAGFIRDARRSGWKVPVANLSFVDSDNLLALLVSEDDDHYLENLILSQVVPSYEDLDLPGVKEYRRIMERYNSKPPDHLCPADYTFRPFSFVSLEGFLNAKLLVHLLSNMGDEVDQARLAEVTENIKEYDLGIGVPISFSHDRHQGMNAVYHTTVYQHRIVPLINWERWKK